MFPRRWSSRRDRSRGCLALRPPAVSTLLATWSCVPSAIPVVAPLGCAAPLQSPCGAVGASERDLLPFLLPMLDSPLCRWSHRGLRSSGSFCLCAHGAGLGQEVAELLDTFRNRARLGRRRDRRSPTCSAPRVLGAGSQRAVLRPLLELLPRCRRGEKESESEGAREGERGSAWTSPCRWVSRALAAVPAT